jgi:hypothetical protein
MDAARPNATWAHVASYDDALPGHSYAAHRGLRSVSPASIAGQRDRLVAGLGRIVSGVDQIDAVLPFLHAGQGRPQ